MNPKDPENLGAELEATPEERSEAKRFAELVDEMHAGQTPPPALPVDQRSLLEVAGMVSAGMHQRSLPPEKLSSIVDQAMRQALHVGEAAMEVAPGDSESDIGRARTRRAFVAGAVLATACAAAAILFLVRPRPEGEISPTANSSPWTRTHQSRPADPLVGRISPNESGLASERLDRIYGDRMRGYRDLHYRRVGVSQ